MLKQMQFQPTEDLVEAYGNDGVVCLRQCVDSDDVEILQREVAATLAAKKSNYKNHTTINGGTSGAFESSFLMWEDNDALSTFIRTSHLPAVAATLLKSDKVNLFFDQCFVKQPGTNDPTIWHVDQPYWPILGDKVITLWIALDTLTPESSVLEFVRGSHQWKRQFQPRSFSGENTFAINPEFENPLDIEENRDKYDIISWDLVPGDVLAFNGMTLHGAQANTTRDMLRRGYCVRYTGDDVIYRPHVSSTPALLKDELVDGGPIDSADYPVVWHA